jgi:cathepsin B
MKSVYCVVIALAIGAISSNELLRSVNHEDFIISINEASETWVAGDNERFQDMSLKEAKRLLGSLKTPAEKKLKVKEILSLEALPDNFDLRTQYPQCESLREVRDQSNCGSCWAFGAAEAMSDRICIASGGKLQTRISTDNLLSCCYECGDGCNGGYPDAAWEFWQSEGLPTGGLFQDGTTCQPYSFPPCDHHVVGKYGPCGGDDYATPECKNYCQKGYPKTFEQDKWYASSAYGVSSKESSIMTEIYKNGSVEVAFTVYEDFLNYKSGVYKKTKGRALGGHAVKMIGWGIENGVKYWLVVNSWNEGWGDNGTFKILRGSNHCGIEGEVVAGIPIINSKFLD